MPLNNLPPDPEPPEDELQRYYKPEFQALSLQLPAHRAARIQRQFALWAWEAEQRQQNDSLFRVHFAVYVAGYDDYLASDLWATIRAKVLTAAKRKCAGCPRKATQVHHRDYRPSVLRGEDDTPLVALCAACHKAVHGKKDADHSWQENERVLAHLVVAEDARLVGSEPRPEPQPRSAVSAPP